MAEKRPVQGADSIIRDIKERRFSPIYILMGDESYYIDKISDVLSDTVLQTEERDFDQTILFGTDTTAVQIADLCRAYPMMAEHRVVIIKEAQAIR